MRFDQLPILRRDPGQVGTSLALLPDQLQDGWRQSQALKLPARYKTIDRIAVVGMGGSHLGADIVRSVWADQLPGPITIVADYRLPGWVNQKTLIIASSYSGGTEETIEGLKAAAKKRLPIVVLATGGKLIEVAQRFRLPYLRIVPSANPSGQPRLATGYSITAILAVLWKIGWVKRSAIPIEAMQAAATNANRKYGLAVQSNPAKDIAQALVGKIPLFIGAEWMGGNLHTLTNQVHENAKTYAMWYALPDLNHHLLEGLRNRAITKQMHAVFFSHPDLHPRTRLRLRLTEKIIRRLGAKTSVVHLRGSLPVAAIEFLALGGYLSWYLAGLRRVQPAPIPTVDELKAALARA